MADFNLVKGCNRLAKRDSDNLLPWLSLACHFYLHGCVCAYVFMCVHVHIVHSLFIDTSMNLKLINH